MPENILNLFTGFYILCRFYLYQNEIKLFTLLVNYEKKASVISVGYIVEHLKNVVNSSFGLVFGLMFVFPLPKTENIELKTIRNY